MYYILSYVLYGGGIVSIVTTWRKKVRDQPAGRRKWRGAYRKTRLGRSARVVGTVPYSELPLRVCMQATA